MDGNGRWAKKRLMNSGVKISVTPHDRGIFTTHFKCQKLPMLLQRILFDSSADLVRARKKYAVNALMDTKATPHFLLTLHKIKYAGREPGFRKTLRHQLPNQRCFLRGLKYDRVTRRKRRNDMSIGQVSWKIERSDDRHHP